MDMHGFVVFHLTVMVKPNFVKNVKNYQEQIEILALIQVVKIVNLFSNVVNC